MQCHTPPQNRSHRVLPILCSKTRPGKASGYPCFHLGPLSSEVSGTLPSLPLEGPFPSPLSEAALVLQHQLRGPGLCHLPGPLSLGSQYWLGHVPGRREDTDPDRGWEVQEEGPGDGGMDQVGSNHRNRHRHSLGSLENPYKDSSKPREQREHALLPSCSRGTQNP